MGEAYIPLALSKRARSSRILGEVARDFGYQLVKMAGGGIKAPDYATLSRMASGGVVRPPRMSSASSHPTTTGPQGTSSTTNFNFDGAVFKPADFNPFVRDTEATARLKALAGGL
jgi:hypothetical protein